MSELQPWYPPGPTTPRSEETAILAIILVLVVVVPVVGVVAAYTFYIYPMQHGPQSVTIINAQITVPPATYHSYRFTVPSGASSIRVSGGFTVTGAGGGISDIEVYLMNSANYAEWQNNGQATFYYSSTQFGFGTITANLPGNGSYYLVYANNLSDPKTIQTTVHLYYLV